MTSQQSCDIFQVISSSSTDYTSANLSRLTNGRRTSLPADPTQQKQKQAERKRSILASDSNGPGLSQLSFEFHSSFDRNGPDRSALRRKNTVDAEIDTNIPIGMTRLRPRLVRQINSIQSNDSAFVDDLCEPAEMDDSSNSRIYNCSRLEELVNQMSIESSGSDASDIVSSQLMKLRSASVDSGYLDTVSSVSSNVWNETNDGLTIVEETFDDDHYEIQEFDDDRLSQSSSNFDVEEEFAFSFNEKLNRLLKGRREIFHTDEVYYQELSSRALKRIFDNIKKFVRHNDWPTSHEIRVDLWRVLCNYKDFESNKNLYHQKLADLVKTGVKTIQPAFLQNDGIVVDDHGLRQAGAVALQRVLIIIECERPELRFVPVLYPLCAMLLHYLRAEEAFASMVRFLSSGSNYLVQSEVSLYASFHTLLALLKKHRRSAYNFLKRRVGSNDDMVLAEVFRPWSEWIFKNLPFDYLTRIIDCYLVEGHKMLLRITLSLVYLWYKQRVKSAPTASAATSPESRVAEISAQITVLCQNCPVSVQTLLDMGFAIRNFKHTTINNLQKHFEDKYREDVRKLRLERSSQPMVHVQRNMYTSAFESKIVDNDSACELMCALPSRFQLETPILLFRLSEHGASFTKLFERIDEAEQSLLIVRTTIGEIFGAYCSACWAERKDVRERAKTKYFGTGESYVFKQPKGILYPTIYNWVGRSNEQPENSPQLFMTAGDKFIIIGSGGQGDAISIREELSRGMSYPCDTYGNTSLVTGVSFEIDELEVFNVSASM
ncbi:Rab-GAP TBC domain-containing protein [Aphelenchoides bicaudatus]|nr:Rab-GAP TBC domain-containing protein [Aphelenchoides bicaudatus]